MAFRLSSTVCCLFMPHVLIMPPKGTVFVTGAAGFVGQAVLPHLLERGYAIKALSRSETVRATPLFSTIRGDLLEPETYVDALRGSLAVIHLAKTTLPDASARSVADIATSRA